MKRTTGWMLALGLAAATAGLVGCPWDGLLGLSGDGQRVVVQAGGSGDPMLVLGRDGKEIARLTGREMLGEAKPGPAFVPGAKGGHEIVYWRVTLSPADMAQARGGVPETQPADDKTLIVPAMVELMRFDPDAAAAKPRPVYRFRTQWKSDLPSGPPPSLSSDGRRAAFYRMGSDGKPIDPRAIVVDLAAGRLLAECPDCLFPCLFDAGRKLAGLTVQGGLAAIMEKSEKGEEVDEATLRFAIAVYDLPSADQPNLRREADRPLPASLRDTPVLASTRRDGLLVKLNDALLIDDGKDLRTLWADAPEQFAFSADGRWLVAVAAPPPASQPDAAEQAQAPTSQPERVDHPIPALPAALAGQQTLYLLDRDAAGAAWRKIHATADPFEIEQPAVSEDGKTVTFVEWHDPGQDRPKEGRLAILDVASGKPTFTTDLLRLTGAAGPSIKIVPAPPQAERVQPDSAPAGEWKIIDGKWQFMPAGD
ncbi:MAG: hypothetical protein BIFFINMI_01842 [Phycisphaerae bacterium]|nr:hypothetical protein [Phycisphaerae bacterium]